MFKSVQKSVQRIVKKNPTLSMVVAFLVGYHLLQKINEGFEEVVEDVEDVENVLKEVTVGSEEILKLSADEEEDGGSGSSSNFLDDILSSLKHFFNEHMYIMIGVGVSGVLFFMYMGYKIGK